MGSSIRTTNDVRNNNHASRVRPDILNKPLIYMWNREWRVLDKSIKVQVINKCKAQAWKEYLEILENHKHNTLTL